jgi:DNA recombination protein RmuC
LELYVIIALQAVAIVICIIIATRKPKSNDDELQKLRQELELLSRTMKDETAAVRSDILIQNRENREELARNLKDSADSQAKHALDTRTELTASLNNLNQQILKDATSNREELSKALNNLSESLSRKLAELTSGNTEQSEKLKKSIEDRMEQIRSGNEIKLEQMRKTVDEKLHETLEKRLGESFNQVTQRLEEVHKGLGEMRSLATGVGDLKRTLEGVKPRGVLGEMQLENLLAEVLAPEQYQLNFKPRPRRDEVVEFAIVMPGHDDNESKVYLPIDAKFPVEDYHRLVSAYEANDMPALVAAQKALVMRIKGCARDIRDKYINPPITTDFAILFLPFESLYAEVLRVNGLFELVMREFGVIMCGPTTIAALLNSLQVGFKTLAIQKKSSEVWKVLAAVKKDFGSFGENLEKTRRKIEDAGRELDHASHRSRQIVKKLSKVEELPEPEQPLPLE